MGMKSFLWRVLYAVVCVVVFWLVFPLFLEVVGLPLTGQVTQLLRVTIACIAILYVLFSRHDPPTPW
jgi:hypothetical protein